MDKDTLHNVKVDTADKAITTVFSSTLVSRATMKRDLQFLRDQIDILLDTF